METSLKRGPVPIRIALEIYFCVLAVRLNDGPHSLMRKKEYHTKRPSEQPKSAIELLQKCSTPYRYERLWAAGLRCGRDSTTSASPGFCSLCNSGNRHFHFSLSWL